ncbi:MAG: tRNA epoxyqueuosine(34) reductase QueG [Amphiplicatus sp.]
MPISISETVKREALARGFDAVGVAPAGEEPERRRRLEAFLAAGRHGDMDWMARRADARAAPSALWPEAKSVVMLGLNYGPAENPLAALQARSTGAISVYARGRDYHDVLKKRLKSFGRWLCETLGGEVKIFVDTAPVMEKPLAQAAGIGWQGKHTNLVSRRRGSWLFLGAVFTTLELAADPAETDHCGACRACLDICPTRAFPAPYELDARRCLSYLTIEHKGQIPVEFRKSLGNRIYGCDDCLAVCPWNKFAAEAEESAFHARQALQSPPLAALAALDDAAFRALFAGSPVKRVGRDRFVRNVMIAIGNSNDPALIPAAMARLNDVSPLVRGAAIWALSRLLEPSAFVKLAAERARHEADQAVRAEWRPAAISPP